MPLQIETQPFQFNDNINVLSSVTASSVTSPSLSGTHYGDGTQLNGVATINYVNNGFLPLSGGIISGATRINNDLTVYGVISATGNAYFSNTVYSTTSALSVLNIGNSGPALWVGNNGSGDIASFYDIDTNVEVLHVGGNNGSFPNVGVKTSSPNVDFTVNGQISANNIIWDANGNSNNWNSVYSNVNSLSGNWDSVYSNVNSLSGNWDSVYSNVNSQSANNQSVYSNVNLLSGNWNSVYSSWNSASATSVVEFNDTRFAKLSSQAYILVDATNSIQPIRGNNIASAFYSNVAGGAGNTVSGYFSNVAGGAGNTASDIYNTIGGGYQNTVFGQHSTIGGGVFNNASGHSSTIAGGDSNTASGYLSNIGGGLCNNVSGRYTTIAGGAGNTASGNYSSILGGQSNNTNNQANTFILGSNITAPQANYTYVNNLSSQGLIAANGGNSNQWNQSFSNSTSYQNTSASFATYNYVNNGFLPLSGGTISGDTRINNNLTVFGNLTATGTTTFANTVFSVTSSLSVVHVGSGPALWVGNNGDGDIASFYDIDTNVEVLHVGGNNGSFPNVGVKTSSPNVDFTVNGQISANNIIWSANSISTPTVSANNIFGQANETVLSDGSNLLGNGINTLTLNYTNGAFINSNVSVNGWVTGRARINTQSGTTYTILSSDAGSIINSTSNTGLVASVVGTNYPAGFQTTILQAGTAQVTLSGGSGITINQANNFFKTSKQWSAATLVFTGTSWVLFGDVGA
jgi:hypothetical protein